MKKALIVMTVLIMATSMIFASGSSKSSSEEPKKGDSVQWWDHFLPLASLHRTLWDQSEAETGIPIVYTQYDPAKQN